LNLVAKWRFSALVIGAAGFQVAISDGDNALWNAFQCGLCRDKNVAPTFAVTNRSYIRSIKPLLHSQLHVAPTIAVTNRSPGFSSPATQVVKGISLAKAPTGIHKLFEHNKHRSVLPSLFSGVLGCVQISN
jgi:hypothetical protein